MVTSGYPASRELNRINIFLRKVCTSPRMFGRFEEYLARLLFEVPLPMRMYAVTLQLQLPSLTQTCGEEEEEILYLSLPGRSELPSVNEQAIKELFNCLSPLTILRVVKYMVLQERIVFISEDRNRIVDCCEALRCLIFPMKYENSGNWYAPYTSLRDWSTTDWSFPAMIGIDKKLLSVAEIQERTTWVVDLDTDIVWKSRHRLIEIETRSTDDNILPNFPAHLTEVLLTQVSEV